MPSVAQNGNFARTASATFYRMCQVGFCLGACESLKENIERNVENIPIFYIEIMNSNLILYSCKAPIKRRFVKTITHNASTTCLNAIEIDVENLIVTENRILLSI